MPDNSNLEYKPEYLEALHKSITPTKLSEKTETASPEIRLKRADKEVYIREHSDAVKGLSFYERYLFVRESLFETNVRGDEPSKIRDRDLELFASYPEAPFPEVAFPYFVKLVDTLDSFIKELPEEKQSAASIRLASIIYGIGVPLHPALDGNGQSLRLIALSYIHEYSPELKDKYFPQRKTEKDPQPIKLNFTDRVIESVGMLENDDIYESLKAQKYVATLLNSFKSEERKAQILALYKSYLENGSYSVENIPNIFTKTIFMEAEKMFKETEEDMKVKLEVKI